MEAKKAKKINRNIHIIRILIALFIFFSSASIVFVWLADEAGRSLTQALAKRYEFSVSAADLRFSSTFLSRQARSFVSTGREQNLIFHQQELALDKMGELHALFSSHDLPTEEISLLELVRINFDIFRDFEARAFAAFNRGDYALAHSLVYDAPVREFSNAFDDALEELMYINGLRQHEMISDAQNRAWFFKSLLQVSVGLFAMASIAGMLYLLTEVKEGIKRERASQKMTEVFLESAPYIMSIWADANSPSDVNEQACKVLELSDKNTFINNFFSTCPEFQACGTPSRTKAREHVQEAFKKGKANFEWLHQTPKGEIIPTEVNIVRFKQGARYMLVAYTTDLRQAKELMQQEAAMSELMNESRAKTRFLARMSHEIRTPLNSIMGIAEIQMHNIMSAEAEEAFNRIYNSSSMLLTIINDILDLAKVEVGKMEINPEPYDVASMIIDAVQLNTTYIGSRGIAFELKVDKSLPANLIGDELRIKQILNNILSNAFKYTKVGSVRLSIGLEPEKVGNQIVMVYTVTDTGMGMTPEQCENMLFGEYLRADIQEVRIIGGAGIGMNIAKHLIDAMNGTIAVESEVGVGTTFTVRIPQEINSFEVLGPDVVASLEQEKEKYVSTAKNKSKLTHEPMPYGRVLVVDDVESNLYVAKGLLKPYGLTVETCTNGQEAVDKIASGEVYDVIFMDHMMPVLDGMEATKLIQAMGYMHPIVALTANAVKGQADIFLQNGFAAFISKPIDVRLLDDCLMQFVRDKQSREVLLAARDSAYLTEEDASDFSDAFPPELITAFLKDANRTIEILEKLIFGSARLYGENLSTYITQVHAIKSALMNVGQAELSEEAKKLEHAAREGHIIGLAEKTIPLIDNLKQFVEFFDLMNEEIEVQIEIDDVDDDLVFLRAQLEIIHDACDDYDVTTANAALDVLNKERFSRDIRNFVGEISSLMLYGDFEEVAEMCKNYMAQMDNPDEPQNETE